MFQFITENSLHLSILAIKFDLFIYTSIFNCIHSIINKQTDKHNYIRYVLKTWKMCIPPLIEWGLYCNHLVRPSVHTYVTDISASTGRNDFIFDIWLWHGDLYRVFPFQVYRTSTSCLQCDLAFFMFAVMKTFVTVISASTGRNDFIFDIWLWHGDLYRVSPFQVYRTSTSCLPCDLQMNEWGVFLAQCCVQHLVVFRP